MNFLCCLRFSNGNHQTHANDNIIFKSHDDWKTWPSLGDEIRYAFDEATKEWVIAALSDSKVTFWRFKPDDDMALEKLSRKDRKNLAKELKEKIESILHERCELYQIQGYISTGHIFRDLSTGELDKLLAQILAETNDSDFDASSYLVAYTDLIQEGYKKLQTWLTTLNSDQATRLFTLTHEKFKDIGQRSGSSLLPLLITNISITNAQQAKCALEYVVANNRPIAFETCKIAEHVKNGLISQEDLNVQLIEAADLGHVVIAKKLIALGAGINFEKWDRDRNLRTFCTKTPLNLLVSLILNIDVDGLILKNPNDYYDLVKDLVGKGANLNIRAIGNVERPLLMALLVHSPKNNASLIRSMIELLVESGADINQLMIEKILSTPGHFCIPLLLKRGIIKQEELDAREKLHASLDITDLKSITSVLEAAKKELQRQQRLCKLHPDGLDLNLLQKFHQDRYRIKKRINELRSSGEDCTEVDQLYQEVRALYNYLVSSNIYLSALRGFWKEINADTDKISTGLSRLVSLWDGNSTYTEKDAVAAARTLCNGNKRENFEAIRTRLIRRVMSVRNDPFWTNRRVRWVHGTKSSTLQLILNSKERALLSAGDLLAKGEASFAGENCGSHKGINQDRISGEILTGSWDEKGAYLYGASTRSMISILYAESVGNLVFHDGSMAFSPKDAWNRINTAVEKQSFSTNSIASLQMEVRRLRMTDPEADTKLQPFRHLVEQEIKRWSDSPERLTKLRDLHNALTDKVNAINPAEVEKLINVHSIVFATDLPLSLKVLIRVGEPAEYLAPSGLRLGKEIPIIFVNESNRETHEKELSGMGITDVSVRPYEDLFLQETESMIRGTRAQTRAIIGSIASFETAQVALAEQLQSEALPKYARPFPERPSYIDRNTLNRLEVSRPLYHKFHMDYASYRSAIDNGEITSRYHHDAMHATRTTIWGQVIAQLLVNEFQRKPMSPLETFALGMTTAHHDGMRQDEGRDLWDADSADDHSDYLKMNLFTEEFAAPFVSAIAKKEPQETATGELLFDNDIQRSVHDADCWEIRRVLKKREHFKVEKLAIMQLAKANGKEQLVVDLTNEVFNFIELTDRNDLKLHLQLNSSDYYRDLLALIKYFHEKDKRYPLLSHLLHGISKALKINEIDPKVVSLL